MWLMLTSTDNNEYLNLQFSMRHVCVSAEHHVAVGRLQVPAEVGVRLWTQSCCGFRCVRAADVLTFCSQSSFRSSLCGELPTPHWASSTSSWVMCPPSWLSIMAAAGSTVSSFTLTTHQPLIWDLTMEQSSSHASWWCNGAVKILQWSLVSFCQQTLQKDPRKHFLN